MARPLLNSILGCWLLFGMGAASARADAWTDALFPEKSHDFGPVPRGVKVKHDFLLVNRLSEPITIVNLRPSCGCTSGRAHASTVPPGQTTVIEAEMDTRNFVGPKATVLFVTLDHGQRTRGRGAARGFVSHPERHRPEPRRDRLRHGEARSDGHPGLDDRPNQQSSLAVHAHGFGHTIAQRPARRDRSQGRRGELFALGQLEARRSRRPAARRVASDQQ